MRTTEVLHPLPRVRLQQVVRLCVLSPSLLRLRGFIYVARINVGRCLVYRDRVWWYKRRYTLVIHLQSFHMYIIFTFIPVIYRYVYMSLYPPRWLLTIHANIIPYPYMCYLSLLLNFQPNQVRQTGMRSPLPRETLRKGTLPGVWYRLQGAILPHRVL